MTRPQPILPYEQPPGDTLTKYDLGILAVRVTGLYFLSLALVYAAYIPGYFLYRNVGGTLDARMIAAAAGPCVAFGVLAVLLLRATDRFVRLAFPEFAPGSTISIRGRDLQAVAYAAIGIYLIASGVPEAVRLASRYWLLDRVLQPEQRLEMVPDAAKLVVQVIAGFALLTRGKRLRIAAHRLRYAGITPPPPTAK